ncbi:hypothetical protein H0H93_010392 [Arthromyces matolae]|nr:hypothetical protein H0H93_010392 [Arthromyces matolae]
MLPALHAAHNLIYLTYLPKKYHQFLVAPVRRVYLDSTRDVGSQNDLLIALEKIKKLEKRNELLMKQCERHMTHAQAQAEGERKARLKSDEVQRKLNDANASLERALAFVAAADTRQRASDRDFQSLRDDCDQLRERYVKLKAKRNHPRPSSLTVDSRLEELNLETYIRERLSRSTSHEMPPEREIRPLPQRPRVFLKPKARPASPPPIYVNKRPKLVNARPRDSM